jgi:UDP-2,3-diacylglucosamine pyrophosphatase LpxH
MRAELAAMAAKTLALLEEEGDLTKEVLATPFQSMLAVSDLHLGPGIDEPTLRWARTENFFCDEAFRRALKWYREARTVNGRVVPGPRLLVLNGDIFDFLRITPIPSAQECAVWADLLTAIGRPTTVPELLTPGPTRSERRFGLRTNDYKSVWKLARILAGHPGFREALAEWVRAGDVILFVKGNHDVELYWPLVHKAMRRLIGGDERNILFVQDRVQIGNVYFEHGHQYESLTKVTGLPYLEKQPDQLNLPPGSFVNRYLINPLERSEPFLDNVKPQTEMVAQFIKRHPIRAIGMLWHSGRFLVRSVKAGRVWDSAAILVYLIGVALPLLTVIVVVLAWKFETINEFFSARLKSLKIPTAVLGILAPYLMGAIREGYVWLRDRITAKRNPVGEDHYGRKLAKALPGLLDTTSGMTEYVAVVGHTHRLDRQILPLEKEKRKLTVTYVNTGTWVPLWPKDRPDLLGRTLHPMLLLDREAGGYRLSQLEWSDAHGKAIEAVILMN